MKPLHNEFVNWSRNSNNNNQNERKRLKIRFKHTTGIVMILVFILSETEANVRSNGSSWIELFAMLLLVLYVQHVDSPQYSDPHSHIDRALSLTHAHTHRWQLFTVSSLCFLFFFLRIVLSVFVPSDSIHCLFCVALI